MAQPTSRAEFKEYILRKIGAPVIQINVSEEQVDDRVDEAVSFWRDYHYNGMQQVYLKHLITEQDVANGYIKLPERLLGISNIFDFDTSISTGTGIFNVNYQFVLNNLTDLTGYSIQNYYMTMQHLTFLQEWLVGKPLIRYNKHVNKLFIDADKSSFVAGKYIIVEAYDIIDPDAYADVWTDRWLQNYAAVLVREQWGLNLTKFTNMQLVGGVSFNGEQILSEARAEREKMEEEAINNLQPLTYNFIGWWVMATNVYFSNYDNFNEQNLIDDLVIESIQIYGIDVTFISGTFNNIDTIFNEDDTPLYDLSFGFEVYVKNVDGFEGEGDFLSKFGLQIRDQVTFTVAIRTFERYVTRNWQDKIRPKEGDVIWLPLNQKMYRITYVEHESVFYQSGALQVYDMRCELMEYSGERFETGIYEVDHFFDDQNQTTTFVTTLEDVANTDAIAQNYDFEKVADDIIDFSEIDPFSESISIQDQ